jgi:malonate decarboxylase delta subunit
MDTFHFSKPALTAIVSPTLVGCVSSGDLEVMIEPNTNNQLEVTIQTAATGNEIRWHQIFDRLETVKKLPAMKMDIHDFSATPGVVRLRIEQALEQALTNGEYQDDQHE